MISEALRKAAQPKQIPLSALNESQLPEGLRHCYRKTAFPPPQFSPMSDVDESNENEASLKENQNFME